MDGDDNGAPIEEITWGRLLSDAENVASLLLEACGPARSPGSETVPIAFLAHSNYTYYTYEVGSFLVGWTVSHPMLLRSC